MGELEELQARSSGRRRGSRASIEVSPTLSGWRQVQAALQAELDSGASADDAVRAVADRLDDATRREMVETGLRRIVEDYVDPPGQQPGPMFPEP